MKRVGKHAALYLNSICQIEEGITRRAETYCTEHGYHLDRQHMYHDTNAQQPALAWLRDAMEHFEVHLVLVPSLNHIHQHLGPILNFLQDAQECQVEIICLEPVPTPLSAFSLALIPLNSRDHAAEGESLVDIVRCLRFR